MHIGCFTSRCCLRNFLILLSISEFFQRQRRYYRTLLQALSIWFYVLGRCFCSLSTTVSLLPGIACRLLSALRLCYRLCRRKRAVRKSTVLPHSSDSHFSIFIFFRKQRESAAAGLSAVFYCYKNPTLRPHPRRRFTLLSVLLPAVFLR